MKNDLTIKQKLFADEYLISKNATQARMKAYKCKNENTAAVEGLRLLRNPKVNEYIENKLKKHTDKLEITQERVLKEFARIAFFDPRKLFDENDDLIRITKLDDDTAAVIASLDVDYTKMKGMDKDEVISTVTKKLKLVDKKGALESLGRYLGLFNADKSNDKDINIIITGLN